MLFVITIVILSGTFHVTHAQCTWLDRIPLPPQHSTPSLLYPLNGSIPCNPQHGVPFGRLAEQSPSEGDDKQSELEAPGLPFFGWWFALALFFFSVFLSQKNKI